MKVLSLLSICVCLISSSIAQNLIANSDFEIYSSCPTALDQVPRATGWLNVIASPDYYNCNFTSHPIFPTNSTAYSGTGCVGFASYGNSIGSSEAVGQYLAQPLLPNTPYTISFASKKATGGTYSSSCGGVALYGFEHTALPTNVTASHPSLLTNSVFLGKGSLVQNTSWQSFTFNFTPVDTINSLVFSAEYVPNCFQCLFLDSIILRPAQGPCPDITLEITASVTTANLETGAVKIIPTGGDAPYLYSLDNLSFQVSNIFTSLGVGAYQVYVTDNNGCLEQQTFVIEDAANCNCVRNP